MPIYDSPVTSFSKRRRLSALVLAFGLAASACGSSSGEDASPQTSVAVDAAQADTDNGGGISAGEAPADEASTDEAPADEGADSGAEAVAPVPAGDTKRSRLGDQLLVANQATTSGRFEGRITISDAELPDGLELVFTGSYDTANQASEVSLDLGAVAIAAAEAEGADIGPFASMFEEPMIVRTVGNRSYVSWSLLTLLTGGQGTWLETEAEDADQITNTFGAGPTGSPADFLAALEEANADITEIGTEDVRGVSTTHLRAIVDLAELNAAISDEERATLERDLGDLDVAAFPIDFWVGDDGLIRRYSMNIDQAADAGEGPSNATVVFEFFDYGADISIEAPPADEVISADELDLEGFGF